LQSRIYSKDEVRSSAGSWGAIHIYTEENTPTYGAHNMLTAQLEFLPGKQLQPPHEHAEEEFQYVIEGSGSWFLNGKEHPLKQGDLMYTQPWDLHGISNTSDAPLRFFVFKWSSKGVDKPIKKH
jgi:quercetin dioxygenase-like cupin family protein